MSSFCQFKRFKLGQILHTGPLSTHVLCSAQTHAQGKSWKIFLKAPINQSVNKACSKEKKIYVVCIYASVVVTKYLDSAPGPISLVWFRCAKLFPPAFHATFGLQFDSKCIFCIWQTVIEAFYLSLFVVLLEAAYWKKFSCIKCIIRRCSFASLAAI